MPPLATLEDSIPDPKPWSAEVLHVEELESRDAPAIVGARLVDGTLLIRGTPGADRVTVLLAAEYIRVEVGPRWWQWSYPEEAFAIDFRGMGGSDRLLIVEQPEVDPVPIPDPELRRV